MRVRFSVVFSLTVAVAAYSERSFAQETNIDTERFKPAVTPDGWVTAEGSGIRPTADPWEFGLFANYSLNSLVIVDQDGELINQFVAGRLGFDALASVTLFEPLSLGLGLPLYVLQTGDGDPSSAGLGNLRIVPKLRILDDRESVGLALALELRAPTHTGDFSGNDGITVFPRAIFDHRFASGIRIGINAGVLFRESVSFFNVDAGNELAYSAALGYRIGGLSGKTELGVEATGGVGLEASDEEELPLEALPFVRHNFTPEWQLMGGAGVGVIAGYGVPTFRAFAGVRFAPTAHDADWDGISDDEDQCPQIAEDLDRQEDGDGCPEEDPDTDQDGVPDGQDNCPEVKETINGVEDDDGCPDSGDPRVIYEDGEFKILDTVQFEHGSAALKPESHDLLNQVALTIKANPQIKRIRIEGHTDDTGPRDVNVRLSKQRAQSVRRYLINRGVSPKRLKAEGFGPDRPLVDETTEEARAKNRRVEFVVESDSD